MLQEAILNVLLIEDQPDAAHLIEHVLTKRNAAAVKWASDLATGLDRLAEGRFDAILLDLNLPDSRGFDTFVRVRAAATQAVIVLTGEDDEGLAVQAVRAGADDYLLKNDIRDRFLAQRIRYAVERHRLSASNTASASKNGKIHAFVGAKGGSGTSTLVANLAAALAQTGRSVIVVEFMPEYSTLPVLLNHTPSWDITTLLRGAPESITRDSFVSRLEEFRSGFRGLCGPQRVQDYIPVAPAHASAVLGVARTLADFILLDVPSTAIPALEVIVEHAALTTLVLERNRLGLNAGLAKMPLLQSIAGRPGGVGAVLVNKQPFIDFLTPAEFGQRLGCSILGVIPPAADALAIGESDALPILRFPDVPFSTAVLELARRM